ncbi:MAG: hypothetical protein K2H29_00220 [Oscillospiraceae bacterium]|nr:hypothetical protein [Oscillospiraceae bacterium]MDE5883498.1 hypothetical protein [Oscillospiraceae bacterium]
MDAQNQSQKSEEILVEVQRAIEIFHCNGILTRSEEEVRLIKAFRMLTETNKVSITSRIEGMLEVLRMKS